MKYAGLNTLRGNNLPKSITEMACWHSFKRRSSWSKFPKPTISHACQHGTHMRCWRSCHQRKKNKLLCQLPRIRKLPSLTDVGHFLQVNAIAKNKVMAKWPMPCNLTFTNAPHTFTNAMLQACFAHPKEFPTFAAKPQAPLNVYIIDK